jgi:membrane-associated protein
MAGTGQRNRSFLELLTSLFDIFLHLDEYLAQVIAQYGTLTYLILFAVIFAETGLVVTPFLPGDSLIFAASALAASTTLNPLLLFVLIGAAAVLGDAVNYGIGRRIGKRAFSGEIRCLKKEYLDRTHAFYEKHGGKTIFLARFVPIVRTFAPFVAGVGEMSYRNFAAYNVVGAITWVGLFISAGYFFGEIPFVKSNFEFVVVAIILVSVLPAVIEVIKARAEKPIHK